MKVLRMLSMALKLYAAAWSKSKHQHTLHNNTLQNQNKSNTSLECPMATHPWPEICAGLPVPPGECEKLHAIKEPNPHILSGTPAATMSLEK